MPEMLLDPTTAVVTRKAFDRLRDYSCSLPTGTTLGKMWKRRRNYRDESQGWLLGCYESYGTDERGRKVVNIRWRDLEVLDA